MFRQVWGRREGRKEVKDRSRILEGVKGVEDVERGRRRNRRRGDITKMSSPGWPNVM